MVVVDNVKSNWWFFQGGIRNRPFVEMKAISKERFNDSFMSLMVWVFSMARGSVSGLSSV